MSVVAFPTITPNASTWGLQPNTGLFRSALDGAIQTIDHGGSRWFCSLTWSNEEAADATRLRAFLAALNGMANRTYVRDHTYAQQGGLSVANLSDDLTTSAFSTSGAELTLSAISDGLRVTQAGVTQRVLTEGSVPTSNGKSYAFTGNMFLVNWEGTNPQFKAQVGNALYGSLYARPSWTEPDGLRWVVPFTAIGNPVYPGITTVNAGAGTVLDIVRWDLSRCLLVDDSSNLALYSEEFGTSPNAWSATRASVSSDATTSPEGESPGSADKLVDTTDANTHFLDHSAISKDTSALWYTFTLYVKASDYDDIQLHLMYDLTNRAYATYALDSQSTSGVTAEGTFDGAYADIFPAGNSWYRCRLTCRSGAEATIKPRIHLHNGTNANFTGTGSAGIFIWGAQVTQGGQIGRYVQTSSTPATAETQQGQSLRVKGMDPLFSQQLYAGDMVELNGQLLRLTADLDADRYGCGVMRFQPKLHRAPALEDAVVLYRPSMRAMLAQNENSWSNVPGVFTTMTLDFIEDVLTD